MLEVIRCREDELPVIASRDEDEVVTAAIEQNPWFTRHSIIYLVDTRRNASGFPGVIFSDNGLVG